MNRYTLITLAALLALVAVLPIYGLLEQQRLNQAQAALQAQLVFDAADLYLQNCSACHGTAGDGVGSNPALNTPALASADFNYLYNQIGHSPHGTAMNVWHLDEGGALNSYQIEALVTFVRTGDWTGAAENAAAQGLADPQPDTVTSADLLMSVLQETDPHQCAACHEEPAVHAKRFGLDCARCHTLEAWAPALLVRHVFDLEHGGQGAIACQTCHVESYTQHTCYGCHDHLPEQMPEIHAETIMTAELENCAACHPTGFESDWITVGK
jgi:mono/diheme cytochrome c family protein